MRVLVADDDPGTRAIVRRVVSHALHLEADEASNGLDCLEFLRRRTYALVVLDLQMPVVGGLEVLESIRTTPAFARTPVVVLTGGADEERVRQAASLGVAAYLAKPINPDDLSARLVQVAESYLGEGRDPREPGDTVALMCGADSAFRKRVASLMDADFAVREADAMPALLDIVRVAHNTWTTRVVLCGLDACDALRTEADTELRALPGSPDVMLFAAVPKEGVASAIRAGRWDGVLSSAMPPAMFVSQFARLLASLVESRSGGADDSTLAVG